MNARYHQILAMCFRQGSQQGIARAAMCRLRQCHNEINNAQPRCGPMVLFLDYDGVLHPDEVYLVRGRPELRTGNPSDAFFMWAPLLAEVIAGFPYVNIVLSTSWVRRLGFRRARNYLLPALRERVIGATWHSAMGRYPDMSNRIEPTWWDDATRYGQIKRYARSAGLTHWVAVDDQVQGWAPQDQDQLIATNGATGLSDPQALEKLRDKLQTMQALETGGRP